jgi:hypothetical protein
VEKKSQKDIRIQEIATQYDVIHIGHFNFGPDEKCKLCSKTLDKEYHYFQGNKKGVINPTGKDVIKFCTGHGCAGYLAFAVDMKPPSRFSLYKTESQSTIQTEIVATSSSSTLPELLPINVQFLYALQLFQELIKQKPKPFISDLIRKTREHGTRVRASVKQITTVNQIINEKFHGQTLTDKLKELQSSHKGRTLRNFNFDLLREVCAEQGKQSYY